MSLIRCAILAGVVVYGLDAIVTGQVVFDRVFAPQQGLVTVYEQPAREEICLNGAWRFRATDDTSVPGDAPPAMDDWDSTPIKIPSPWNVNSFCMDLPVQGGDFVAFPSYPKQWEQARAAWMETSVSVPAAWSGRRILLHFGAVAGHLTVYINGKRAGDGFDLFFAHEFDVTDLMPLGQPNTVRVKVIAPSVFNKPGKFGNREYIAGSFWGIHVNGIWQDVFLLAVPEVSVADVFVQPWVDRDELVIETTLVNRGSRAASVNASGTVREWINKTGKTALEKPEVKWTLADATSLELPAQRVELGAGETRKVVSTVKVDRRLKLWDPQTPNLYGLLLNLSADGKPIDTKYQRFGWRQFTIDRDKVLLNGQPIVLRGDSWHFMGVPQMTRRYAYAWYTLLRSAGANAVRPHASVYPPFYHDLADEMGMMVLDESAIWLSDGATKGDSDLFWRNCRDHIEKLVRRDRNHPSVFGWSICNEILPVIQTVWRAPQSMTDHCLNEMSAWCDIVRRNDPTRPWISGDGEWDADGRLPVINLHYGDVGHMQRGAKSGKPWGVGETSMAYYGTPKGISEFNGNRAYESALGRMEGLAFECYHLLSEQQKNNASYQSVFNIPWYAIKPLPLGKRDLSKPVAASEGITFGPYQQGVPGMQPERLGPYTTTLNPGYDPALPLYEAWPMFDAIRDANTGNTSSRWATRPALKDVATDPPRGTATLHFLPDNGGKLVEEFGKVGVNIAPIAENVAAERLMIDAAATIDDAGKTLAMNVLQRGGTVWIWNITSENARSVGELLGQQVIAEPFQASSFVVKRDSPLLAGLDNAMLYLSEEDDWKQMTHGLGGEFVQKSGVLLEACPADWRKWNHQPEPVKTAALYRSELERAGPRAALVVGAAGGGRVILCNINPQVASTRKRQLIERLMLNEGIQVTRIAIAGEFLDDDGQLIKALVLGSYGVDDLGAAYSAALSLDGRAGAARSAADGIFNFDAMNLDGPKSSAFVYVVVQIKSPRALDDLLAQPDLPRLSFTYGADDGCQVWLNGQRLASHQRIGPMERGMFKFDHLPLKLGWNQLVIKVIQAGGDWSFAGRFDCTDRRFLPTLTFAANKPGEE
jgi:beta-galactosidase